MKVYLVLLVGLSVFEATLDAAGHIIGSSSHIVSGSSSSSHVVSSSSSSSISSSSSSISGGSFGIASAFPPPVFPFPRDIDHQHFDKCSINGQWYEQGHHTLQDCQGLYCGPNGYAQIRRCGQISIPGATCDGGVALNPTAQYPGCCRKKYTCTVVV